MDAMNQPRPMTRTQQHGAATLIVAIILLLALTLATFSAARIGVSEQRSVANEIRAKQAFWVAQGGVEQGIAFLNANKSLIGSASVLTAASPPIEQGWVAEPPRPPAMRWSACRSADARRPPCAYDSILHGNRWMFYNNPNRLAANNFFRQLAINGNPSDYLFDLDFLAWSDELREDFGQFPRINSRIIVTATVTTPIVGADPLRALPGATSPNALRVSQIVSGYDTLVGQPGATLPPVGGVSAVTSFPPYIDAPLMVAGRVELNAGVSIWGNPAPTAALPVYHNRVFDTNPPNPQALGRYIGNLAFNIPMTPVVNSNISTNDPRPISIWSRDSTTLGVGTETCVPVTPLSVFNSGGFPGNYRTPRLSGPSSAGLCSRGIPPDINITVGNATAVYAPNQDIVACVPYPPTFSTDLACAGMRAAWDTRIANATAPPFFPPDLFYYVFGIGNDSFRRVRNDATVRNDCAGLETLPSGLYWVDGNCTIAANTNVGGNATTPTAPITLVVNGGTFRLNAGVHFWGTVFLRGGPPNAQLVLPIGVPRPVLHGALIADQNLTVNAGNLDLVYDPRAFSTSSARAGGFAKVLGGWADRPQ